VGEARHVLTACMIFPGGQIPVSVVVLEAAGHELPIDLTC